MHFDECETVEDCKKLYKKLAKTMHPDMGGSAEEFQEMFDEYTEVVADMTAEPSFLSDEYVTLAKAVAGVVRVQKPEAYKTLEGVVRFAPAILSLFEDNRTAKNVNKFLGKLDL